MRPPLILHKPSIPLPSRRTRTQLRLVLRRFGDHFRRGRERGDELALAGPSEEDDGPALEGGLISRWRSVSVLVSRRGQVKVKVEEEGGNVHDAVDV